MIGRRLPAIVIFVALASAPADAATITTDAFVAVAAPTIAFLDAAGRLASAHPEAPRVRAFARAEVASQDAAADTLAAWRQADAAATARDAFSPSLDHLGPVAGLLKVPYEGVANATASISPPLTALPSEDRIRAAAQQDLARLATLQGADFTDVYVTMQIDALRRLEAAYKSFILNGDDQTLRALAVHGLPKVEHLLALARRL